MAENHREREIPVFTVLKNNCILKNIFLLDSPPAISPSSFSLAEATDQESQAEEILVVGRHPDCNIKLEHPSISRFHLRIHSKPYFRSLSVTDLSSVHGTWISGKKIESGVTVQLNEGDTLRLGASSRLYKLSWVPISCAYDLDNPFLPALGDDDIVAEETGEIIDQENNALDSVSDYQVQTLSDTMEGLELLFSDEDSSIQKGSPAFPLLSRDMCDAFPDIDIVEKISSSGISELENEISSSEPCRFDKENDTPCAHSPLVIVSQKMAQLQTAEASGMKSVKSSGLSIWSRRGKPESVHIKTSQSERSRARIDMNLQDKLLVNESHITHVDHLAFPYNDDQFSTPDKENASPNSIIVRSISSTGEENVKSVLLSKFPFSSLEQNEEEMFTPNKENMTPNKHLLKSVKSRGILEEVKHPVPSRSSPLKGANNSNRHFKEALLPVLHKEYQNQNVLQERRSTNSSSKSQSILKKQSAMSKAREDRGPFHPLPVNSTSNQSTSSKPSVHELNMEGSRSITYSKPEVDNQPRTLENKTIKHRSDRWIIVVDTNCLLDKNSRKELQLLRGLRGTTLVIPRIVVRELDIMLRRGIFFRRTSEVSAALQWIEESMAIAKWWIRVQSSAEEGSLIPPTPPASSHHWFTEDKPSAFSLGSTPFSPYSLQEIVTPTATDHILDCALHYNRIRNDDEQLVLLTDGVALKIKAMAEGVICETAGEFRRSLVNPFSTRFLYSESSPIGPSWSSADDVVLKEKYYPSPSKKLSKSGEGVKGLKLVLLHNSNFRQTTPVSSFT